MSTENHKRIELAVNFEPDAIREHFEEYFGEGHPLRVFVAEASEDTLWSIGLDCILSEHLWEVFHELLVETVAEFIEKG